MSIRGMQVLPNDPGCVDPRRPQFDEATIDRKSYINVGDLVNCISDVTFKDEETADIIATTLEWIIGKRSIPKSELVESK